MKHTTVLANLIGQVWKPQQMLAITETVLKLSSQIILTLCAVMLLSDRGLTFNVLLWTDTVRRSFLFVCYQIRGF